MYAGLEENTSLKESTASFTEIYNKAGLFFATLCLAPADIRAAQTTDYCVTQGCLITAATN